MRFSSEREFCRAVTEILLGVSVGSGRKLVAIAEVPWGYFSNEQFDMLLLDVKNLEYLEVEYKLWPLYVWSSIYFSTGIKHEHKNTVS